MRSTAVGHMRWRAGRLAVHGTPRAMPALQHSMMSCMECECIRRFWLDAPHNPNTACHPRLFVRGHRETLEQDMLSRAEGTKARPCCVDDVPHDSNGHQQPLHTVSDLDNVQTVGVSNTSASVLHRKPTPWTAANRATASSVATSKPSSCAYACRHALRLTATGGSVPSHNQVSVLLSLFHIV
jgi:hypothetical protein